MYFGKYHDIEVEDDVIDMEYENGATGLFVTSTVKLEPTVWKYPGTWARSS